MHGVEPTEELRLGRAADGPREAVDRRVALEEGAVRHVRDGEGRRRDRQALIDLDHLGQTCFSSFMSASLVQELAGKIPFPLSWLRIGENLQ